MAKKKSFGEIWSELTDEQTDFLKDYIDNQKKSAVEHYKRKVLNFETPWSLKSALKELIHSSEILLQTKDYDGHGWELKQQAQYEAQKILDKL